MAPERTEQFFRVVFKEHEGYVCLSRRKPGTREFQEEFFLYPEQVGGMVDLIDRFTLTHDLYYCPQLLDAAIRTKEHIKTCPGLWADLDTCPPDKLLVPPTIITETSPNRFQGLWLGEEPFEPAVAEDLSRRIAYYHAEDGADKSGWDLTQLLRVPFTHNHKYTGVGQLPQILVTGTNATPLSPDDFSKYPEVDGFEYSKIPFPSALPSQTGEQIMDAHRAFLNPAVLGLYTEPPEHDWSKALWLLENYLFEAGLTLEEAFVVCQNAACNKYKRDGKSEKLLWLDVCRARANVQRKADGFAIGPQELQLPELLTDEERHICQSTKSIVEEYVEWAKTTGDAAWQYHEAGAFIILSSLLGGNVRLPTSFGPVFPNVWFMILADTTLTRKTTAMDVAMDILDDVDPDIMLATDGSIEGLLTALSMRPGRPSVFLRDEFSGLLEAMTKKDYYAGMAETLTKLYDGRLQKRILRKEVLEVRDPRLIIFAGGIKNRVLGLLTHEHVSSGFIPRFIFILAESDVTLLKPLGPPTERNLDARQHIIRQFKRMRDFYCRTESITIGDKTVTAPKTWEAELSAQAWARYNYYEQAMLSHALRSDQADILTPSFDRLAKSGLKLAVLIAASRDLQPTLVVSEQDIIRAFYYIEKWRHYTLQVITGVGRTPQERLLQRILEAISKKPGITRSVLMQNFHLMRRDTDTIFDTLEQRGLISRTRSGGAEKLFPVT